MKTNLVCVLCLGFVTLSAAPAEKILLADDFQGKLAEGWSWLREDPSAWRVTERGLEVRVQPGNMWGPANNARNVLVRPVPDPTKDEVEVGLTVENRPTEQYEQVDLVWYYSDSFMVKLGQEMVDGKLSIVMGREEGDRTRTIAIVPLATAVVRLRLAVSGNRIQGQFRPGNQGEWQTAGTCDLPVPPQGKAHVSVQCYQGPANTERWAKLTEFRLVRRPK
jgi:regulation of enolase protein 1 (concanavalin A-like superfamily)